MQPAFLIAAFLIVAGFAPQAGAQSTLYANEVSKDGSICRNLAVRVEQDRLAGNYTEAAAAVCSVSCAKARRRIACAGNETCRCYCGRDGEPVCSCSAPGRGKG